MKIDNKSVTFHGIDAFGQEDELTIDFCDGRIVPGSVERINADRIVCSFNVHWVGAKCVLVEYRHGAPAVN